MRGGWTGAGLAAVVLLARGAAVRAATTPREEHVRGDVVARSGDRLVVRSRAGGRIALALAPGVQVTKVEKVDRSRVKPGAFVGTTTVKQTDGSMRALEVHVFPESMRGTGEGQRAWDRGPDSKMTNGSVAAVRPNPGRGASTMTNGNVADVRPGDTGETLALEFQGGKATVLVPPGTPVVSVAPGSASELAPGAHVFAAASRGEDGALVAHRIVVGKGIAPPM